MVATRGSIVDFVTGTERVDPESISPLDWARIVNAASHHLTLEYLRGLKSIQQILAKDGRGEGGTALSTKIPLPVLTTALISSLKPNSVFLDCGEVIEFPKLADWPTEVKVDPDLGPGYERKFHIPFRSSRLLFNKSNEFFLLSTTWELKEVWDEGTWKFPDSATWTATKMEMEVPVLANLIAQYPKRWIGLNILSAFTFAQMETTSEVRGQFQHTQKQEIALQGYLRRLGHFLD